MEKSRLVDIEYMEDDQCIASVQTIGEQAVQRVPLRALIADRAMLRQLSLDDHQRLLDIVTDNLLLSPLMKLQFWIFCKLHNMSQSFSQWEDEACSYAAPDLREDDDW